MKPLRVYFPDYYLESHRLPEHGQALVEELTKYNVQCVKEIDRSCNFVLCGSVYKAEHVRRQSAKYPYIPVIQYCWDLYPFQVQGPDQELWGPYLKSLEHAREVWVPSNCTVKDVRRFTDKDAVHVVKAAIRPWDDIAASPGNYVVDVMRKYPDPNQHLVAQTCQALGIECIETSTNKPWEEFRSIIAGARLLVSAYKTASTGGLSLLEGHYLGKPVLLSNSVTNGAVDYFGSRATYFESGYSVDSNWRQKTDFMEVLESCYRRPQQWDVKDCQRWIKGYYTDTLLAYRISQRLWKLSTT